MWLCHLCTLSEHCRYLYYLVRAPSFHALHDLNCPSTRLPFTVEDPSKASGLFWVTGQHQKQNLRTEFSLLHEVTCSSTCFPGAWLPEKLIITVATSAVHLASVLDLLERASSRHHRGDHTETTQEVAFPLTLCPTDLTPHSGTSGSCRHELRQAPPTSAAETHLRGCLRG